MDLLDHAFNAFSVFRACGEATGCQNDERDEEGCSHNTSRASNIGADGIAQPQAPRTKATQKERVQQFAASSSHVVPRRKMVRRRSQRLTVSAASVPAAARTAACGIATVRPRQPTIPYQEKIGEVRRFLTGSCSAA